MKCSECRVHKAKDWDCVTDCPYPYEYPASLDMMSKAEAEEFARRHPIVFAANVDIGTGQCSCEACRMTNP